MVIVLYDAQGRVQSIITQSDVGLIEMSQKYTEQNVQHVLLENHDDIDLMNSYVVDGEVLTRPLVTINGSENRPLKADSKDKMILTTDPICSVIVYFNQIEIARAETNDPLEITSDFPGEFVLIFDPSWPYQMQKIVIEVVAP